MTVKRVTTVTLQEMKGRGEKITMLTAYDYPIGRFLDEVGIEVVLVGDSLAMVGLGYETTLPVTMEEAEVDPEGRRASKPKSPG